MAYFYEIRSADNMILKRDGGFADPEAAKSAARADAKKMKDALLRQGSGGQAPQPGSPRTLTVNGKPTVGRILLGRNLEMPTRY